MWAALAGLAGSIYAGSQLKKAILAGANREMALAKPRLDMLKRGGGAMWDYIQRILMPKAGKESPLLRGQHEQNIAGIGRESQKATAESEFFNESSGNIGRGRGEALRIADRALKATNAENLGYGSAQEGYKLGTQDQLWKALAGYTGQGRATESINASRLQTQGASDFYGDLGELSGAFMGYGLDKLLMKKYRPRGITGSIGRGNSE